jgi:hypothetical protein
MPSETRKVISALLLSSVVSLAWADGAKTAIGSGLGGAAGAAVGQTLGGSTGAIVGGAAGGAVGAAATTKGDGRTGAIVGGAVGGGTGAAVGQTVGGSTGAVVGAGVGGAAGGVIGREVDRNSTSSGAASGTVTTQTRSATTVVQTIHVVDDDCGPKRNRNHPGKGWAKGHYKKNC